MFNSPIRRSQLIAPFGVGALLIAYSTHFEHSVHVIPSTWSTPFRALSERSDAGLFLKAP